MDFKEQVTKWVENKIEKIIVEDLKEKIIEENASFDVEDYVDNLIEKYFNENDVIIFKESLCTDSYDFYFGSENSSDEKNSSHDSLELDSNGYQIFSVEEIIKYLKNDSEEVKKKSLQALELSAEDLINQNSWNILKETLQKMLNNEESKEIQNLVLKIFQKLLKHSKKTEIVCKAFITVTEIIANQINLLNLKDDDNTSFEKIYDITEDKWVCEKNLSELENFNFTVLKKQKSINEELLIKLMWLLVDCQQQIPVKWARFNETKFREIIFSFIHLLSSTTTKQDSKLSGLKLLSILNPKAGWVRYWCHTAIGRSLLCSALRKYKNFLVQIVETILGYMRMKKASRLPSITNGTSNANFPILQGNIKGTLQSRKKSANINQTASERFHLEARHFDHRINYSCSAPSKLTENKFSKRERQKEPTNKNSEFFINNIPTEIVSEAVFFHSISFVSCLIQFRNGRALFPVQIATRKRLVNVQDLSLSIIEYLENDENYKWKNVEKFFTSEYQANVSEILHILKKVKTHTNSSRMSTEKQQFSYP